MTLLQNTKAIGINLTTKFEGSGGVPPYSYAVQIGGAGGTIDPLTGLYLAPSVIGVDTIEVIDAVLDSATATISIFSPLQLFCDVLKKELGLSADQIWLYNQKFTVPNDSRLYIAVNILTSKSFSNVNESVSVGADLVSMQATNFHALLSVDIMSRGLSAVSRKEEVVMALNSNYARQQMELNGFGIANQPSNIVAISDVDGAAIPYRFNFTVAIQYVVKKRQNIEFYDDFFDTAEEPEVITDPPHET